MTIEQNIDQRITAILTRIHELEQILWHEQADGLVTGAEALPQYQAAFREMESLIALKGNDQRHDFFIIIPVADRPQHLQSCLNSLLTLCLAYGYGGYANHQYQKLSVIIADDSKEEKNIIHNQSIADTYNKQGISTHYFGLNEQLEQMDQLSESTRQALSSVLGNISVDAFYHKGSSIMRNIAYLALNKIQGGNPLFYFIDSDQEFQLKINTPDGAQNLYACNYFYQLDRIFSLTNTTLLTGKVVGDPPVSPAVMASNFLDDVLGFVQEIAAYSPSLPCQFHGTRTQNVEDAAYHDMASLFGFKTSATAYQYHCNLPGGHDNARCFSHFSSKLSRFFYGEHPTRKTWYHHEDALASIHPARTVYTGNYLFKPEALRFFIPFASLKLRMAGPVMGRLIKAELQDAFVSANLPMLHKRTVRETGQAEFRPGISVDLTNIDLSGELERQFYGDLMLFSIEKLITIGYPKINISKQQTSDILKETHQTLLQQYNDKHLLISQKLDTLKTTFNQTTKWWNLSTQHTEAVLQFKSFIANLAHNFGAGTLGHALINSSLNREERLREMVESIAAYMVDQALWLEILSHPDTRRELMKTESERTKETL
jgi:hypothetical protein